MDADRMLRGDTSGVGFAVVMKVSIGLLPCFA